MKPMASAGGATALALVLLFCATAPASAHEDHKKKAQDVASEQRVVKEPAPPTTQEEKSHDPANHSHEASSATDSVHERAPENNVPKLLAWLGKFHPPLIHFPIALLTAAALAELLFKRTGAATYRYALLFCVRIGAGAAVVAAVLGWFFGGFRLVDEEWVMTVHRWAGTSVALFSVWLLYMAEQLSANEATAATTTTRFRAALFAAAGLVTATGFLGGAVHDGLDHYAW